MPVIESLPCHIMLWMALVVTCFTDVLHAQRFRSPWLHDVEHLEAEPGYRSLTLRWQYRHVPEPPAFRAQVCEVLPWTTRSRCRQRTLELPSPVRSGHSRFGDFSNVEHSSQRNRDVLRRGRKKGSYEALIQDLRMMTNYTVAVEPDFGTSRNSLLYSAVASPLDDDRFQLITSEFASVTTKGFAARAERCLANSSEVVVHTGPYFAGKISVEDAPDACSVVGDQESSLDAYTLLIDHKLCGSRLVNRSKIETNIIVHENRDIITHNTRRYLVVCSFVPDTYTITASVNLPPIVGRKNRTLDGKDTVPEALNPNEVFTYQHFKESHVGDSRIMAEQHSLTRDSDALGTPMGSHAVLMAVLVVMGLAGCGVAVWYAVRVPALTSTATTRTATKEPLCALADNKTEKEAEADCTVVNYVTISGKPVALLPDSSASEA